MFGYGLLIAIDTQKYKQSKLIDDLITTKTKIEKGEERFRALLQQSGPTGAVPVFF